MPRKLTNFDAMWSSYPNPGEPAAAAKATIGGAVDTPIVTNTCVVRVSRAMNYAGHRIPRGYPGLWTLRGADKMNYALRVAEMRRYLRDTYGRANVVHTYASPPGEGRDALGAPDEIVGKRGILCFVVDTWSDATGHLDLWDGDRCIHTAYFREASSVHLWLVAGGSGGSGGGTPSADEIGASVGQGGANDPADVALVQQLLLDHGEQPGPVDGDIGPKTIAAIRRFQRSFLARPDGRVDPGGRTWRMLKGLD